MADDVIKTIDLERNQILHTNNIHDDLDDPLQQFMYALRALETRRQYPKRLKMFMDFIQIEGDLKQQTRSLKEKTKKDIVKEIVFKISRIF